MGIVGGLGIGLLGLALPLIAIALVVSAVQRAGQHEGPAEPGVGTVRRLFIYGLSFFALGLGASGVALLLGGILDAVIDDALIATDSTQLATALSLTVVGLPVWAIFFLIAQRTVRTNPVEHRSLARGFYFMLVRGIALAVFAANAISAVQMALGLEEFSGSAWGWLLVAAAVWALHERLAAAGSTGVAAGILHRAYLAFGSVLGLYLLAGGILALMLEPAAAAYDALFRSPLIRSEPWSDEMTRGAIAAAIGGVIWWWHWIARLRSSDATMAWHVVVFIFGILVGVATAVVAGGVVLHSALTWALTATSDVDAAEHFAGSVTATAFALVGLALWQYHHAVLRERIDPDALPTDPERVYRYLLAAAGLAALGSGVTVAIALAIDGLVPIEDLFRSADWWREEVATALTLVIVGGPLWAVAWSAAQRSVARGRIEEREALPRRAFLFLVFAVALLLSITNLAVLLFEVFDAALASEFGRETVRDVRWSVAMLIAAGVIAGYYWLVLREDQGALRGVEATRVTDAPGRVGAVTIVGPALAADTVARRLRPLGITVRIARRMDLAPETMPESFQEELDGLVEVLLNYRAPEAVVLIRADDIEITPVAPTTS